MNRNFYRSSSFYMALFFAILIICAILMLIFVVLNSSDETLLFSPLLWLSMAMIISVSVVSFLIAIYVVKRIRTISIAAENIIKTRDLEARISMNYEWDDLSKLASLLNQLFEEIEVLVTDVQHVTNNIAHDLRTPLTRLIHHLENIEDKKLRNDLISESQHLLSMFNGLLRIAEVEIKPNTQYFADIKLNHLIEDAIDLYEPIASEKQIVIDSHLIELMVSADKDLLFQAIVNLIDNAIKYNHSGGTIHIKLVGHGMFACLTIIDDGEGVNEKDLQHLSKRFFRTDSSRKTSGHGLGLSLVEAVIKRLNGKVSFASNAPQGFKVVIELPLINI